MIVIENVVTAAIVASALLALAAIIATIPLRTRRILSKSGKMILPLENGVPVKVIGMFILSGLIIAIIPMRNFAPYIQVVIALAALLAAWMAAKEASGLGKAGIYEDAIIWGTEFIPMDDILSIPTLAYENDPETVGVDMTAIEIIRKSSAATVTLTLGTEEKRAETLSAILRRRPDLKTE